MIKNPIALLIILLAVESFILFASSHKDLKRFFKYLPSVFWIYFTPMLLSTAGIITDKSPLYSIISNNILPASLVLLLLSVDTRSISKLGKKALIMMFIGSAGIMIAMPVVFYLFRDLIGREYWAGFGALSASWIGGSANLVAVKEAIHADDAVFLPMVVVDTIVPYVWMGILVASVRFEKRFDTWNRADGKVLEELHQTKIDRGTLQKQKFSFVKFLIIVAIAAGASFLAQRLAVYPQALIVYFPRLQEMISPFAWVIIIITTLGLGLSLTPVRQLERNGATDVGYFLLYLVLTTIGAKASLASMGNAGILILAGFCVVLIHAVILIVAARLLKAPLFLAAVSSQANIGGVASAPIVAEIYKPGLAYVGLLMAILGNILGTYLGIVTSQVCRWVSNLP